MKRQRTRAAKPQGKQRHCGCVGPGCCSWRIRCSSCTSRQRSWPYRTRRAARTSSAMPACPCCCAQAAMNARPPRGFFVCASDFFVAVVASARLKLGQKEVKEREKGVSERRERVCVCVRVCVRARRRGQNPFIKRLCFFFLNNVSSKDEKDFDQVRQPARRKAHAWSRCATRTGPLRWVARPGATRAGLLGVRT